VRVSVIIPSRNERFLLPTVQDVLAKASGDLEVIVILDGYWPSPALPDDKRLKILHRGTAQGMRPGINAATHIATGEWLLKLDAHVMVEPGFDDVLKADCDKDWIVVPRRDRLDPIAWCKQETGKPPIDAHYLSNPLERPGDLSCGLHGTVWHERARKRKATLLDEEMSSQGSCWFMHREHWNRIGPMDVQRYGSFIQEFQELGLKTWLGGGRVMVNKKTTYYHLHKGKTYGRGYPMRDLGHTEGAQFASWYWMTDQWAGRVHDLKWLVEQFWPVPTWPEDLDKVFAQAKQVLKNPYGA
jgi:hypothetical protein